MRFKKLMSFLLYLIISTSILFSQKIKEGELSPKYRDWLKLVNYIILPQEKEVFLQLKNDRDRDIFIESFWRQRDPTPGTSQNEFKDEHINRFLYANEHFRRGTTREGWMTDMGKIYIILGPPKSIERFDMQAGVHPCEVWFYYGDKKGGLPTHFAVIFYKRGGIGEYKLYNPASDGPESLIIDTQGIDLTDYSSVYKKIKELAPTLANVSFTLVPGQVPYRFTPSPSAPILLASILEYPKKNLSPTYATNFLNYKGIVDVEYATNFIECIYDLSVLGNPKLDLFFVHFSINPKSVSVDYFEPKDQYYLNYQLTVSIRKAEEIIFQYTKDYPLYFSPLEMEKIRAGGLSIQDSFPVISGDYTVTVLLQNSVGKDFSFFERRIYVPEKGASPFLSGIVLAYDFQKEEGISHLPYKIGEKRFFIDPSNIFSPNDKIILFLDLVNITKEFWEKGEIEIKIEGSDKKEKRFDKIYLREFSYSNNMEIYKEIQSKLYPDYYEININLKKSGIEVQGEKLNFSISNSPDIPHPNIFSKKLPSQNEFLLFYMLATQAEKLKNNDKAEIYYRKTLELNPDYVDGILGYSNFLLKMRRFENALIFIEKLKDNSEKRFEYFLLKGQALMGLENFSEAINNLLEANKIYNSDLRVLNSIGYCYFKIGKREEAIRALKSSLSLNPKQKEVEDFLRKIEGERR